ncbi:MAG: nucleotide-binding universal stress UspA family protein [Motiliproteus sp.]|jgi:nucleotide-binding universal stress UspA family protein
MRKRLILAALCTALSLPAVNLSAADQDRLQEQLYGSQLMTEAERAEQRARMRSAETLEEQERIREEHHERMEKRAEELGIDLPDEPMPGHGSMMQGSGGMGSGGMGSGGMGSGGGRK